MNDDITGITAYISYKGYSSDKTIAADIPAETIVMERTKEDGSIVMSVCCPDLGIELKGYTTVNPSQERVREVTLNGIWKLKGGSSNATIRHEEGRSIVTTKGIHGQPVEFEMTR